ncbi:plasmid partitioning protein RepB [Roseovarius sp. MMSF_3281]|uniref:plasmid partitioning protein RepB n=1 Tax=Roseovarius sp. MMSF_3281 TaxID=3046694 RepID=UPI00273EFBF8|nr:plasmid partitioning protein RepB [Roseovarius sp. MMSF_3281]
MARKHLLQGLMDDTAKSSESPLNEDKEDTTRVDPTRPRYKGGAIGAVSQSIADLKSRSVIEIDPNQIEAGGLDDRLDDVESDHRALVASIRESGQQVPVLVRPHPTEDDRYQVVYGRRRVLALRDIGKPVKALVRDLDDRELILAQGQENSARKDLSFIEKANFAKQMRDLKYDRKTICAALHVDKTVISRMLSVIDRIPIEVIEAIGAAPSVGRDRWLALAERLEESDTPVDEAVALVNLSDTADNSDKRFEGLMKALTLPRRRATEATAHPKPEKRKLKTAEGNPLGHATFKENATVLTLPHKASNGFETWLIEHLAEIHRAWKDERGE